jgi:hypothetical protein
MRRLLPPPKKCYSKAMTLLLVPFMMHWMRGHLSKSRTLRGLIRHGKSWRNPLRTLKHEGCKGIHSQGEVTSFKMKEDESVPEMVYRLQVLVNDLKALREEVKDKDFSHKFLRCLLSRFGTLVTILARSDLDTRTPNHVLEDM